MGDIVEMMMEGILCQVCGVYLGPKWEQETAPPNDYDDGFKAYGYPKSCRECEIDEIVE